MTEKELVNFLLKTKTKGARSVKIQIASNRHDEMGTFEIDNIFIDATDCIVLNCPTDLDKLWPEDHEFFNMETPD